MPTKKRKAKAPIIDATQDNLVIVESPAKAKTIKKYLGKWFEVVASMGHVVDLAKGNDAIDKKHNFEPTYVVSSDKKSVVASLKKAAKTMTVWIATDEDREGEAIGWHLCRELKLDIKKTPRIVFHEITKDAIDAAVANPRTVDIDLVDAQQARRVLDRLVWFDLSPVLWKKVKSGLSAGRVQSVAVKLLVERERTIQAFETSSSFKVTGTFLNKDQEELQAEINKKIADKNAIQRLFEQFQESDFTVKKVDKKPSKKHPSPPFTTSSLQQAASTKLWFSVSRTMQVAQRLYEAGYITYMRTDSVNMSQQAIGYAKAYILDKYGSKYTHARQFASKNKFAQQAHECIRPTDFNNLSVGADDQQKKLYHLIRQRTLAGQMTDAEVEKTSIDIQPSATKELFIAKGEMVIFDGFLKIYDSKDKGAVGILPKVSVWDILKRKEIKAEELFVKAPARFTEASLVKKMEELGIGRPSTYAPTISTIQKRGYVDRGIHTGIATEHTVAHLKKHIKRSTISKKLWATKGKLVPTSIGMVVTDFLQEHFAKIMDYTFTSHVEEEFDIIATGNLKRQDMIKTFYAPFSKIVSKVADTAERASGERGLGDDPETGRPVSVRIGRYGPLVQIGKQGDEDITYASLPRGLHIETVSLEQAMEAFALPRDLGEWEGKMIKSSIGRFGPYVQRGSIFASLKDPDDPYEIEFDRALELVQARIKRNEENTFQTFVYKDKEGKVMKSRWSNVIKRNSKTIKLAKGTDGEKITLEEIGELIEKEVGSRKKRKTTKKKTVKKSKK